MPHKLIMNSGRVYVIKEYEEKNYSNGWIYFKDEFNNMIIGVLKNNVEAEIFQESGDVWEIERVNQNN